jgi:hypothetical protein
MSSVQDARTQFRVKLAVSDSSEFRELRAWMRALPGVTVSVTPAQPEAGELGAIDVLSVAAGSGGALAVAIKTLPDYLRARRSSIRIEMTFQGQPLVLTAKNADNALSDILKLLLNSNDITNHSQLNSDG